MMLANKDIIEKLTDESNFKESVKMCLEEDIDISCILEHSPEINVYHYNKKSLPGQYQRSLGDDSAFWFELNIKKIKFYIDGVKETLSGVNNFFAYVNKINTIILPDSSILRIKFRGWTTEDNHYEISYHLHSTTQPAFELNKEKYFFLQGEFCTKQEWLASQREAKLNRVMGNKTEQKITKLVKKEIKEEPKEETKKYSTYETGNYPSWLYAC